MGRGCTCHSCSPWCSRMLWSEAMPMIGIISIWLRCPLLSFFSSDTIFNLVSQCSIEPVLGRGQPRLSNHSLPELLHNSGPAGGIVGNSRPRGTLGHDVLALGTILREANVWVLQILGQDLEIPRHGRSTFFVWLVPLNLLVEHSCWRDRCPQRVGRRSDL